LKIKKSSGFKETASIERPTPKKIQLLCWGDAPTQTTGFGIVMKNVLKYLYKTGKYDVDIIGVNYYGDFYDKNEYPYQITPAALLNKADPYGCEMLLRALKKKNYDLLFVVNDTFVTTQISQQIQQVRSEIKESGQNPFRIIYYYPVDCGILPTWKGLLDIADKKVAYNNYGKAKSLNVGITPDAVISHGVDTHVYKKLPLEHRRAIRSKILKIDDDNTFLFINVNRNSLRKDIARTILAFNDFLKIHPNSKLYLHTAVRDGLWAGGIEIDLAVAVHDVGLEIGKQVLLPAKYETANGIPPVHLNELYNSADAYITTTTGEGFGLSTLEAMSAEVPVVVPASTSFFEIIGADGDRGYMYPCKEKVFIDSSGFRPVARLEDIVSKMDECYRNRFSSKHKDICSRARKFAEENSWAKLSNEWIKVFDEAYISRSKEEGVLECL